MKYGKSVVIMFSLTLGIIIISLTVLKIYGIGIEWKYIFFAPIMDIIYEDFLYGGLYGDPTFVASIISTLIITNLILATPIKKIKVFGESNLRIIETMGANFLIHTLRFVLYTVSFVIFTHLYNYVLLKIPTEDALANKIEPFVNKIYSIIGDNFILAGIGAVLLLIGLAIYCMIGVYLLSIIWNDYIALVAQLIVAIIIYYTYKYALKILPHFNISVFDIRSLSVSQLYILFLIISFVIKRIFNYSSVEFKKYT